MSKAVPHMHESCHTYECVMSRIGYGCACDMWSIGVIAYMILCGQAPFDGALCAYPKSPILGPKEPYVGSQRALYWVNKALFSTKRALYTIMWCHYIHDCVPTGPFRWCVVCVSKEPHTYSINKALFSIQRALFSIMWCHCIYKFVRTSNF